MANNIKGNAPNAVVAKTTVSFVDAGINATNTEVVYMVDNPLLSYVPGRAINGISGFVANKGYYIVAKVDMDLTAYLVPPLSGITQLNTPTNFTATAVSQTQINLAWDAVASATGYVVDRATNSSFTTGLVSGIYSGSGTSHNATGLTAGTTYYFRVRATAAGFTDSNYATASGTTQTAGGTVEDIVWAQLQNATAPGGGDLVGAGTLPQGGTATKKLSKVNGNYIQHTVPATVGDSNAALIALDSTDNADYRWSASDNSFLATIFQFGGTANTTSGPTNSSATTLASVSAGHIMRLEISGDNVLARISTNGGSSFTTLHTWTGVLTGITDIFVVGVVAIAGSTRVEHAEGLGLTT